MIGLEEHGITFPVLTGAWQPSLMRDYDLRATPTHILVGADNAILFRQDGYTAGDEEKLEAKITEALATIH